MKEVKERYLLRWTTYRQLKRNGLEQTKTKRLKDGSYKTYAHFERDGKYFLCVTRWKFLDAQKTYSQITKSWNEHSYTKVLKRELKKFKKSKYDEFNSGIQKFYGKIISARSRKIQGHISKVHYISLSKKTKAYGLDIYATAVNMLSDEMESVHTFLSGEWIKRKRKKVKKNARRKAAKKRVSKLKNMRKLRK